MENIKNVYVHPRQKYFTEEERKKAKQISTNISCKKRYYEKHNTTPELILKKRQEKLIQMALKYATKLQESYKKQLLDKLINNS